MMKHYRMMLSLGLTLLLLVGGALPGLAEESRLPELESGKVVLTWTELKALLDEIETLKQAQEQPDDQAEQPPVEFVVTQTRFNGTIETDRARFDGEFAGHVFKHGWVTIPLFSGALGIERIEAQSAKSDGAETPSAASRQPAAKLVRDSEGYALVAAGPGSFTGRVTFYAPVQTENLLSTLEFEPPAAVINRVSVRIPEADVDVVETAPAGRIVQTDAATTYQAFLSRDDTLKLVWKQAQAAGIRRKSRAVVHALAAIEKTALTVSATVTLEHVTEIEQIVFQLPPEVEILDVSSADIERWYTEPSEQGQRIRIAGAREPQTPIVVRMTYRTPLPDLPAQVSVPVARLEGVETLNGYLGLEVSGNLEVTPDAAQHGVQIAANALPAELWRDSASPLLLGYEFHDPGFQAGLRIKSFQELQTVVANVDVVDCVTHRTLAGKSITRVRYVIRNNDRQFLTLRLPEDSRIWQVFLDGAAVKPAQKQSGDILIPLKKSAAAGDRLQAFTVELGYITEVSKLSLKGELVSELPALDIPSTHLRWTLYLPEDYEYTNFEGPLKQVEQFSPAAAALPDAPPQIEIPTQGKRVLFEKYLVVDETPYVRGKYGQYLGDDIFLSVQPRDMNVLQQVKPGYESWGR
jgi:hypothetical protein